MQLEGFADVTEVLRPGVYALCAKGRVIYVGKSRSMLGRINTHRKIWADKRKGKSSAIVESLGIPGLLFDEVHVFPCRLDQLDAVETEMINKYKPHYNKNLKNGLKVKAPINITIAGTVLTLNAAQPKFERRI